MNKRLWKMKMMRRMQMIIEVLMKKIFFRFLVNIVLKEMTFICKVQDKKKDKRKIKKMLVLVKLKTKIVQKARDQIDLKTLILIYEFKKRLKEKNVSFARKS